MKAGTGCADRLCYISPRQVLGQLKGSGKGVEAWRLCRCDMLYDGEIEGATAHTVAHQDPVSCSCLPHAPDWGSGSTLCGSSSARKGTEAVGRGPGNRLGLYRSAAANTERTLGARVPIFQDLG